MTVNRKKAQQKQAVSFIVTASTRDEATHNYLALSSGEDAQNRIALADPENNVVVSMSSSEIGYNPLTGEPNLVDVELDNEELALHSVSSSGDKVQAFYAVCSDGCGQHILTSEENIYFCPSCSTALPAADDEDLDFHSESGDLDDLEHVGDVNLDPVDIGSDYVVAVAAATPEEAFEQFIDASNGTNAEVYSDGGKVTYITSESSAMSFAIDGSEVAHVGHAMPGEEEFTSKSSDLHANIKQCSDCSMFSVSSSEDLHNCIQCGGDLVEPEEDLVQQASMSSDSDLEEDLESEEDEDFELELEEDEEESEEEEEDDLSSISSSLREDLASLSGDDEEEEEEEEDFDLDEDEEEDEEDIEGLDLDSDDEDEEESEEEEEEEDMTSESSNNVTELDVNMLTALASNEPNGELNPQMVSVAHCGTVQNEPTWVAFYGKYPVATATASTVKPEHKEMLNKPTFATAVLAAIAADGVEVGLKDFGFEAVSPEIQVEAVVDRELMMQAESRVQEVREAFEAERLEYSNRFLAALATASLGINRQVFRGVENPTARYLVASLSAAGVRNAEELVNDAFVQTSDMYNKTLIAKASDLVGGSVESQNNVAEMVASASAKPLVRTGAQVTIDQQQPLTSQSSANKQPTTAKPGRYSSLIG